MFKSIVVLVLRLDGPSVSNNVCVVLIVKTFWDKELVSTQREERRLQLISGFDRVDSESFNKVDVPKT